MAESLYRPAERDANGLVPPPGAVPGDVYDAAVRVLVLAPDWFQPDAERVTGYARSRLLSSFGVADDARRVLVRAAEWGVARVVRG